MGSGGRGRARKRERELAQWVEAELAELAGAAGPVSMVRISGDASFRSYYRASLGEQSWVAVDAPPGQEDCRPFVEIAGILDRQGLNVPSVHAFDLARGFMLQGDLGDDLYSAAIARGDEAAPLYGDAVDALIRMQAIDLARYTLPHYDHGQLLEKMQLFSDWMLTRQLGLELSAAEQAMLGETFEMLAGSALEQPQVFVHRDYHSRNLLVAQENNPAIVDFQDAAVGAITYDLVSLLRDCYIEWPEAFVDEWVGQYLSRRSAAGQTPVLDPVRFRRWFDWMGMQRHIRVAGVFCRLHLRDGKAAYLGDLPLVMRYLLEVAERYPEFASFAVWLRERVVPAMGTQEQFGAIDEKLGSYL